MSDLQSKVNRTVQGFIAEVIELVHHTAVETLQVAFADPASAGPMVAGADRGAVAGSGRRRTPEDLDLLARRLAIVIRANPGLRIAELGERLGTPPRRLTVPIRKLIAEGAIQARGIRRTTTYFAVTASNPPDDERDAAPVQHGLARPAARREGAVPGEHAVAPAGGGFDAEWYRCLAGVFMFAHKLQK